MYAMSWIEKLVMWGVIGYLVGLIWGALRNINTSLRILIDVLSERERS
jgi:hypothetical protein